MCRKHLNFIIERFKNMCMMQMCTIGLHNDKKMMISYQEKWQLMSATNILQFNENHYGQDTE